MRQIKLLRLRSAVEADIQRQQRQQQRRGDSISHDTYDVEQSRREWEQSVQ